MEKEKKRKLEETSKKNDFRSLTKVPNEEIQFPFKILTHKN